jgi:hypothetical protein
MEPSPFRSPEDERLDGLFRAYRSACEPRPASANFMPELWQRIERVQTARFSFQRIAKGFVTSAAALSLALAVVAFLPSHQNPAFSSASYIEALAAHTEALAAHSDSNEYVDFLHLDSPDDAEEI